jgi:4-alpha-glucanotransferase
MKVLQFAFAQPNSPHLPHCYEAKTVVYTGTHDNDTARGWYEHATAIEHETIASYLGVREAGDAASALIRAAYTSVAELAIVPVQDILNLGSEARMNRPGAEHDNWSWRLAGGTLTAEHAEELRELAQVSGRI